jgi:hypothetical protein
MRRAGIRDQHGDPRHPPHDKHGGAVEITDFAPRFRQHGRMFQPTMTGAPPAAPRRQPAHRVRLRPAHDYGRSRPAVTWGSNHVRYVTPTSTLRLTTDASITAVLEEMPFFLDDTATLLLGPDETLQERGGRDGRHFAEETAAYWREWVRYLAIPFEWQEAVIRAAITLKLNAYDDTGAIVAAMTTSIPEAAGSGRNWDYRYCWLRDGYFVVNALNRLGATRRWSATWLPRQHRRRAERRACCSRCTASTAAPNRRARRSDAARLPRHGAGARRQPGLSQVQHDVYGSAMLAATHVFFDRA